MNLDVVACGVGGQGVVTLGRVVGGAALREGYDVRVLGQSGLSQVGAPVMVHLRIGTPAGPSPKVPLGAAHVVIGLERMEALKLVPYLRPGGTALLSDEAVRPYEARFRPEAYPDRETVETAFCGQRVLWIPALELARRHGSPAYVGAVMAGALAAVSNVVDRDQLVLALRAERPREADEEVEAFFAGYEFLAGTGG
ncbi:2-oxoacid:acceptor oxidoreductase family protein [Deferrisoma camini]|uniref:2-oxoacid:acceptor oxidoreductase family protein n=1 Tax=Deferrisoma camini TaxID=1035120 RepID=UPI00046D04C1|nr:2-oxoacid:acceptor oxidoreductase family protein [Deferrisoma camini]